MAHKYYNFNTTSPEIEARVDTLLTQMTLEEKVGQTVQTHIFPAIKEEIFDLIRKGRVGSLLNLSDREWINEVQKAAVEETRLGIPLLIGVDVIHGFRTIFPIPLAEACTWDPELVEKAAHIAAEEASANGIHWTYAPMVDIARDPRWGRIAEGSGEDPFLGAMMAAARVRGFQSELGTGVKLMACPKHYAAYGFAEGGKDYNTTDLSERTLRDVVLPPFKAAFEAGAGSTMSAFNDLNGVPATANAFILRKILREEWGFKGIVVSDWNSIGELVLHGFSADLKEAAQRAFLGGVEIDMISSAYQNHLADLVSEGTVAASLLDEAVRNILRAKFALGLFENAQVDLSLAEKFQLQPESLDFALEIATKSMVLLKNEGGLLPIDPVKTRRIALIGPLADDHQESLGTWSWRGRGSQADSILDCLHEVLPDVEITYLAGCGLTGHKTQDISAAVKAAQESDLAILAIGEGEFMTGEAHSRVYLGLPGHQQEMLEAVHATGTPIVVVLLTGRPMVIPWMAEHIPAILLAWHSGMRTGRAAADLLVGHANPSGKLTTTWPRAEGQIPLYYAHKSTGRPPDGPGSRQFDLTLYSTYLDEYHTPLFPFGYGLSYTQFVYEDLKVHTPILRLKGPSLVEDTLVVSAMVTNTGGRAGEEIIQLYVRDLVGEVTRPVKELKGFQKIYLEPGGNRLVRFAIRIQALGFHGLDNQYKVEPGEFRVWIGPNSSEGLDGSFWIAE